MENRSFQHETRDASGRREALSWLARQLRWERRLGELRHGETATETARHAA
jgi:hypothetical protein